MKLYAVTIKYAVSGKTMTIEQYADNKVQASSFVVNQVAVALDREATPQVFKVKNVKKVLRK
jgi:hypothetical protein